MLCRAAALFSLVLLLSSPAFAPAQQWTRFRGPNGSGISEAKTIPVEFTEKDFNWKVELPGSGISSPVVWGQRVFITAAEAKDTGKKSDKLPGTRYLVCINTADGSTQWSRPFEFVSYRKNKNNTFATSTPAVDADHVYVLFQSPEESHLHAFTHDGQPVWTHDLGPFQGGHGGGVSPIVYEDLVVVCNDQEPSTFVVAVDRMTGQQRWQLDVGGNRADYATPCVYQPPGRPAELVFSGWKEGIYSVDPTSGKLNWQISVFGEHGERSIGSPVLYGDLVIGTCGFTSTDKHTVAVRPEQTSDGIKPVEVYRTERSAPHLPTALVYGDRLFLWSEQGIGTCLDAATGRQIWQKRIGGAFAGSPVCVDGKLYCIDDDGVVVCIAAADQYEELGRSPLGEITKSTPAVSDGVMYLRTFTHLISVGGPKKSG